MKAHHTLKLVVAMLLLALYYPTGANAQIGEIFSKALAKTSEQETPEEPKDSTEVKPSSYAKLLKDATKAEGFLNVYLKKGSLYLEIPTKYLGAPMLYSGRVAQISDNSDVIAGQMPDEPLMISWSKDEQKVYLHQLSARYTADPQASIYPRFQDNHLQPILHAFNIKAWNPDSTAMVIDATDLFLTGSAPMSPFLKGGAIDAFMGTKRLSGQFKKSLSSIIGIAAYPTNLCVTVRGVYSTSTEPFTAVINGSILLLPTDKMTPRLADERIGYFENTTLPISTDQMKLEQKHYIQRWRLEARPEDRAKQRAGQLVEPMKPIIFYYDTAFPREWWPYIKEGVEDWQKAFEAAGFKNAIIAKPYPNDPDFNPNDARYSCIIYSTSRTANAMGPAWTDPRTGEILQAAVYFYHNVLELLHDWRFTQTSAADPKAREKNYSIKVLGPMLRYLIGHEVGHTLGLMHNMAASTAYSIQELRSPSFTNKWGTTPSIMDYARYNYIAQPGDGVTNFLPPRLGVYDIYAIRWGYRPIYGAKTPEEEVKTLSKWIEEKAGDKRYFYGPQQFLSMDDPYALTEDLGDDRIEASRLGINNLKITAQNLFKWTEEQGKGYKEQARMLENVARQFRNYMGHCSTYIGGYLRQVPTAGKEMAKNVPVPREKQKEALLFILNQVIDYPDWIATDEARLKLGVNKSTYSNYMLTVMSRLLNTSLLSRINTTAELPQVGQPYRQDEYMEDLFQFVWADHSGKDEGVIRNMRYSYVTLLINQLDLNSDKDQSKKKTSTRRIESEGTLFQYLLKTRDYLKKQMEVDSKEQGTYASLYYLIDKALK